MPSNGQIHKCKTIQLLRFGAALLSGADVGATRLFARRKDATMDTPTERTATTTRATRRTVIGGLAATPLVAVFARWAGRLRRHAAVIRPTAEGTSSTRCAACGAEGHSMLACPSNPKVV